MQNIPGQLFTVVNFMTMIRVFMFFKKLLFLIRDVVVFQKNCNQIFKRTSKEHWNLSSDVILAS